MRLRVTRVLSYYSIPECDGVQDVVVRRGKLWVLYKRSGHRVIINTRGDLIVRPTYAEANVQRVPGGETFISSSVLIATHVRIRARVLSCRGHLLHCKLSALSWPGGHV